MTAPGVPAFAPTSPIEAAEVAWQDQGDALLGAMIEGGSEVVTWVVDEGVGLADLATDEQRLIFGAVCALHGRGDPLPNPMFFEDVVREIAHHLSPE